MNKLVLSGIIVLFSGAMSCQLLHFFSPAVINVLNFGGWHMIHEFNQGYNIRIPEYSIAVDPDNLVYFAYIENFSIHALKVFNEKKDGSWGEYGVDNVSNYIYPIIKFSRQDNPAYPFPIIAAGFGGMQLRMLKCESSSFNWDAVTYINNASGVSSMYDYFIQDNPFLNTVVAYAYMNTNFILSINTDTVSNYWNTLIETNTGYENITGISVAQSVHGHLYVCVNTGQRIYIFYYNIRDFSIKVLDIDNGAGIAKIFIDKRDYLHCIYTGKWDEHVSLKYKLYKVNDDTADLDQIEESEIYQENIFMNPGFAHSALALEFNRDREIFYIGFIDMKSYSPIVMGNKNGSFYPIPGFPSDLTNCLYIKLSVDLDNKAVAAIAQINPLTNVYVYQMN